MPHIRANLNLSDSGSIFPVEWTTAVLILALMSVCMVLPLFA